MTIRCLLIRTAALAIICMIARGDADWSVTIWILAIVEWLIVELIVLANKREQMT